MVETKKLMIQSYKSQIKQRDYFTPIIGLNMYRAQQLNKKFVEDFIGVPARIMRCSVCGKARPMAIFANDGFAHNYCANCGADMREAEREPTMEEYMYGQDLGSVEDGSL